VSVNNQEDVLTLEEAMVLLRDAEEERSQADLELKSVLRQLGLE
jgi:type I restriction enzyme M protein